MVTTQDVSFGMLWAKLVGGEARWAPGDDDAPPLKATESPPTIGPGLVAVWVVDQGPILVCMPNKGLRVLKTVSSGTPVESIRNALRDGGAVVIEQPGPRADPPAGE